MAFTFHGIGTMRYGERDFRADGSYIVTEWFVMAYFPVFPLRSKRVKPSGASKYIGIRRIPTYDLLELTRPNFRQVICVYAWFVLALGMIWAEVAWNKKWFFIPGVILLLFVPWYLRKRARGAVAAQAERLASGMSVETID